jgi:hypothetical protein
MEIYPPPQESQALVLAHAICAVKQLPLAGHQRCKALVRDHEVEAVVGPIVVVVVLVGAQGSIDGRQVQRACTPSCRSTSAGRAAARTAPHRA